MHASLTQCHKTDEKIDLKISFESTARPCERCVKKGLANTCTDGARKKAKYLLDEDEICERRETLQV